MCNNVDDSWLYRVQSWVSAAWLTWSGYSTRSKVLQQLHQLQRNQAITPGTSWQPVFSFYQCNTIGDNGLDHGYVKHSHWKCHQAVVSVGRCCFSSDGPTHHPRSQPHQHPLCNHEVLPYLLSKSSMELSTSTWDAILENIEFMITKRKKRKYQAISITNTIPPPANHRTFMSPDVDVTWLSHIDKNRNIL